MQPTEEDAREDPLFDDPDDLDYDEDMARLMREVYSAFKSEVSGADLRADASKLKDMLAGLQAEAQGNTPLLDSTRHAGVTTIAARCAFAALRRQWAVAVSSPVTELCSRV